MIAVSIYFSRQHLKKNDFIDCEKSDRKNLNNLCWSVL